MMLRWFIHTPMIKLTFASATVLLSAVPVTGVFFFWQGPRVAGVQSPVIVRPGQSIQAALNTVAPGSTVVVKAGTYTEKLHTPRSGTGKAPITLRGEAGTVLVGESDERLLEIKHDYWRVEGLEFRGADILLWLQEADHTTITRNFFHEAQGECVRAKYHSSYNVFSNNRIENCGREDFAGDGDGKNGEGIYLGTAPEQLEKNPTPEVDRTSNNTIRHNVFQTNGNECVDIKEGSSANVIEFNDCTGQKDPESAGFDARGSGNIFRYNKSYGNAGAGLRFGGDEKNDGTQNTAYGNQLVNNAGYAIKVMRLPQGKICGNTAVGNRQGLVNNQAIANSRC